MAQSRVASENAPKLTNFKVICQLTERSTYEIACSLPDKVSENINLFSFICYTRYRTQRCQLYYCFFLPEMDN